MSKPHDKLRILGRSRHSGGARWLRLEQHLDVLARLGLADCGMVNGTDKKSLVAEAALSSDVIVSSASPGVQDTQGPDFLKFVKFVVNDQGIPWIWDVDDDFGNVNPYNPAYRYYGLEEVTIRRNGEPFGLWRNGEGGFDLGRNQASAQAYSDILSTCTALTTTTEYLAEKLRKLNPNVYLRPNVCDFDEVWKDQSRLSMDGRIRILYMGGASHFKDLETVYPALFEILRTYPHVDLIFFGDTDSMALKKLPEDRIERYDWTSSYRIYALRLQRMRADIGIAPLCMEPDFAEFNRSKSPVKWTEYAAVGIPCVAQKSHPYEPVINFGLDTPEMAWNGMLAATPEDWFHCLSTLIESAEARMTIGRNAHYQVKREYDAVKWGPTYLEQYEAILQKQEVPCG